MWSKFLWGGKKLWTSDLKWSYSARVINKWTIFISPLAYEAWALHTTLNLVEVPWIVVSNIYFIARQILGIHRFQIETKKIFSIVGVLTSLCHCRLRVENLDKLVIIMKNWSFDSRVDCMCEQKSLDDVLADEANIIDDNDIILDASWLLQWWWTREIVHEYFVLVYEGRQLCHE